MAVETSFNVSKQCGGGATRGNATTRQYRIRTALLPASEAVVRKWSPVAIPCERPTSNANNRFANARRERLQIPQTPRCHQSLSI